jgi:hypothetical protein
MTLSASAADTYGHSLTGLVISWTVTCGVVSPTTGSQVTLTISESAAGTSCTVTATSDNATGTATLAVGAAGPFAVTVTPSTISPSGPQTLTATVKDSQGRPVPDAQIEWRASCGELSQSTGATTVYTPPADTSGAPCTVTAAVAGTDGASQTTVTVASASASLLPLLLGVVVAGGAGAGGFLVWRKRKQAAQTQAYAPEEAAQPEGQYEAPAEQQYEVPAEPPYEPPTDPPQ